MMNRISRPRAFSQQFDAAFFEHLSIQTVKKQFQFGVLGIAAGSVFAASMLHAPILGIVMLGMVGGAGGGVLARYRFCQELRQAHLKDDTRMQSFDCPAPDKLPSINRLEYLTSWGHAQLLKCQEASPEKCFHILFGTVHPFAPFVTKLLLLVNDCRNGACGMQLFRQLEFHAAFKHLKPLYCLLQQKATAETVVQIADRLMSAFDYGTVDDACVDQCCVVLPTILGTLALVENAAQVGCESFCCWDTRNHQQKEPASDERLKKIYADIRKLLWRHDVQNFLANTKLALNQYKPDLLDMTLVQALTSSCLLDQARPGQPNGSPKDPSAFGVHELVKVGEAAPHEIRLRDFPHAPCGVRIAHSWCPCDETMFELRSRTYLRDGVKIKAGPPMTELLDCDITVMGPDGPVKQLTEHPDFYPRMCREAGEDRFLLVLNWVFPPYQCCMTSAMPRDSPCFSESSSPQALIFQKFLRSSDKERADLLKIIVGIEQGPFLVKKTVRKKPVLIGRKIKTSTCYVPQQSLEITFDVSSGEAEKRATSIVLNAAKHVDLSFAFFLESREPSELPETLLACAMMSSLDTSQLYAPMND